jgi:hypothetical protein
MAPLGPGSGVLDDDQDRERTTHMKLIGPVDAGLSTVVHLPSGRVRLVPVHTTDEEMDPDTVVMRGGSPHLVDQGMADILTASGLGSYLTPID